MTGADLIASAHPLGLDLLSAGGEMVPQVLAVDGEGEVVGRTMLLGDTTPAEAASRLLAEPGVIGLVYVGLADREDGRALFLEAVSRLDPEVHFQLFQGFRVDRGELSLDPPGGFRVPAGESHLGPVFAG